MIKFLKSVALRIVLLGLVGVGFAVYAAYNHCEVHRWRCVNNCTSDYLPGPLRVHCLRTCEDKERDCEKYGSDEP